MSPLGTLTTRQTRRRAKRASRRVRTARAIVTPARPASTQAALAAMEEQRVGRSGRSSAFTVLALLSFALHAGLGVAIWRGHFAEPAVRPVTRISARIHQRPPEPPPEKKVVAPPAATAPKPPKPVVTRVRRAAPTPPPPTLVPPPEAPPPVVGLSKESTTDSGNGPAFAVGDTLAGTTDAIAAAPHPKIDPVPAPAPVRAPGRNRVASGAGVPGSVLTPPKRIHEVKPHYPDALRAKGVEADVVLVASIDASGKVIAVTVAKSSGDPSFDEAARSAALQERFSPALRDGTPVPTTIPFTTHFRLDLP